MKYNPKVAVLILAMFIAAQLIALYVVNFYSPIKVVNDAQINVSSPNSLPFGLEPPPANQQVNIWQTLLYIIPAFVIAISLFFILSKLKAEVILKGWFFIVIAIAISISIISFLPQWEYAWIVALAVAVVATFFKIYRRNFLVHNLTELLVYPGIAAIFVAMLSSPENPNRGVYSMMIILVIVSLYDMWAVWHSKVMQKMAKYQINKLKMFAGFFIPYVSREMRDRMKKIKKSSGKSGSKLRIKAIVAGLGGGDIVFPAITAGVVLRRFGFIDVLGLSLPIASLIIVLGAALGLSYLLFVPQKNRFYPAMPFISAGLFAALGVCYLLSGHHLI